MSTLTESTFSLDSLTAGLGKTYFLSTECLSLLSLKIPRDSVGWLGKRALALSSKGGLHVSNLVLLGVEVGGGGEGGFCFLSLNWLRLHRKGESLLWSLHLNYKIIKIVNISWFFFYDTKRQTKWHTAILNDNGFVTEQSLSLVLIKDGITPWSVSQPLSLDAFVNSVLLGRNKIYSWLKANTNPLIYSPRPSKRGSLSLPLSFFLYLSKLFELLRISRLEVFCRTLLPHI